MSGGKVVAWRCGNTGLHWALRRTEPKGWAYVEPLVLQSDLAAAIARAEAAAEALRTVREYVVAELECQRDNFKGFEHCSDIDSVTADLAAIDAAIAAQQAEGEA